MPDPHRTTRYSDVCGGTDEFKRILTEEPLVAESQAGRETLASLLEDGMYMLHRTSSRNASYSASRPDIR